MNDSCLQSVNDSKATTKAHLLFSFETVLQRLKFWRQRSKQRKHLASLDDHLLDDIGYTRKQVKIELAKPFWK